MKTIRNGVFETNSSSCHVLALLTTEEREDLLNKKAILHIIPGDCYGPENELTSDVLNYAQFVQAVFDELFADKELKKYREQNEKPITAIVKQFWKDIVEDREHICIQQEAITDNACYDHCYELMAEWNDIKGENVERRLSRYLQFLIPTYTYEHLLENMAVKQVNHNTIYAVSWEKDY